MKKILFLLVALTFICGGVALADVQIDKGQSLSTAPKMFMVVRYARNAAVPFNTLSKDSVVVWDTTSNDGVSIRGTTTSNDPLVAGILLDSITRISSDNAALADESNPVWGRVQTWGRYAGVSLDSGAAAKISAGDRISTHSSSGQITRFDPARNAPTVSWDGLSVSHDSFAVAMEAGAQGDHTLDIFIRM